MSTSFCMMSNSRCATDLFVGLVRFSDDADYLLSNAPQTIIGLIRFRFGWRHFALCSATRLWLYGCMAQPISNSFALN